MMSESMQNKTMASNLNIGQGSADSKAQNKAVIVVQDLKMHFPIQRNLFGTPKRYVKAVDGVSFTLFEREALGLVGESGCGKTTLGRCIMRVYQPTSGKILFHEASGAVTDLAPLRKSEL